MSKVVFHPLPLGCLAVTFLAALARQPAIMALGLLAWLGTTGWLALRVGGRTELPLPHPSELHHESRLLLRPLVRLHREIEKIVHEHRASPLIRATGEEALRESRAILLGATKLAEARATLRRGLREKAEAEIESARLERLLVNASEHERPALESAQRTRRSQIDHFRAAEAAMSRIEGKIAEARAAMTELKARLQTGVLSAHASELEAEELTEVVGRLKTLSRSLEEAESLWEEQRG